MITPLVVSLREIMGNDICIEHDIIESSIPSNALLQA